MAIRILPIIFLLSLLVAACGEDGKKSGGDSDISDGSGDADAVGQDLSDSDIPRDADVGPDGDTVQPDGDTSGNLDAADLGDVVVGGLVQPLYPVNGAYWTSYVADDGTSGADALDSVCDLTQVTLDMQDCFHAGEWRVFEVPDVSSCAGVTATDNLSAFDWICDDSTGSVRAISTGLADGMRLTDLVDWSGEPAWRLLEVSVVAGGAQYRSAPGSWWPNTFVEVTDASLALAQWEIGAVTGNAFRRLSLSQNTGLVVQDGATATIASGTLLSAMSFTWVEGTYATSNAAGAMRLTGSFHRLNHVSILGGGIDASNDTNDHFSNVSVRGSSGAGIALRCNRCLLEDIRTEDSGLYGLELSGFGELDVVIDGYVSLNADRIGLYTSNGDNITVRNAIIANSGGTGMRFSGVGIVVDGAVIINPGRGQGDVDGIEAITDRSHFSDISIFNASGVGFWVRSATNDNIYAGITAVGCGDWGIDDGRSNAGGHVFSDLTIAHNEASGYEASSKLTMMRAAIFNNDRYGLDLGTADEMRFYDMAMTDNVDNDYYDSYTFSSDTQFHGQVMVTDLTTSCQSIGTAQGLDDSCAPTGGSTATVSAGTLDGAFVGLVDTDDTANTSDTNGAQGFDAITDWASFDNRFRGWARDGMTLTELRSFCPLGAPSCRIHDMSLVAGANVLGVLPLPADGDDVITHGWWAENPIACDLVSGVWTGVRCETTFLRNAREISGDGVGNDDSLCVSGERCFHTPNIGAYQGHGDMVEIGPVTDGALTGITLYRYAENGR